MKAIIQTFAVLFLSIFISAGTALAQSNTLNSDLSISDIAGNWRIEVIGNPDDDFKGTADIPFVDGKSVIAQTITEDKCCGGKNHARVLQDSRISITGGQIDVSSKIVKYLLREEELPIAYSPDDFSLRRLDENTLIGTANGRTRVRWVRDEPLVS